MKYVKALLTWSFLIFCLTGYSQGINKVKITDLDKRIRESKKPLILNFWATYCIPCIEEIPYFEELAQKYGVELLLVSMDLEDYYPDKIKASVAKHKFLSPVSWLDEYDADYFCPVIDSSWSGAIPASLFLNNQSGYRKFVEEQISREKLESIIQALLGKKN